MRNKLTIVLIIVLGFILRFYMLGSYPAFNADEAALGYNAYSLLETGKDEHGNPWPIHFQSFNDYKPGLYVYLLLPFIKLFGLNEWAVRSPGAFLGSATVLIIYLLVNKLHKGLLFPILTALFLAISPWHIHFSRGAWEVNVATFFITLGIYLFLLAREKPIYYIFSIGSFVLSLYTYHSARLIAPLIGLGLLLINIKYIRKNLKYFSISVILAFALCIPLLINLLGPAGISRAAGVGLFADPGPKSRSDEQRTEHVEFTSNTSKILHNKLINYSLAFVQNWSEHFHGEFLFLSGEEIERNKVPETGQLYIFEIITIGVALCIIARKGNGLGIVIFWLVIAPVAAALTFQSPHALRAQNMVIPLTIISAYGLSNIIFWINKNISKRILLVSIYLLITIIVAWSGFRYLHMYYVHMAKEYPFSSQYGVKELVSYTLSKYNEVDNIVITDRYDQPYILFLFYGAASGDLKYAPIKFQDDHVLTPRDQFGFSTVRGFDKFVFKSINNWDEIRSEYPNSLIVGTDEEIFDSNNIVQRIYGSNGYLYFEVVKN